MSSYSESVIKQTRKGGWAIVEIIAIFLYVTATMGFCLAEHADHLVYFLRWVPVAANKLHGKVEQTFVFNDNHKDTRVCEEDFNKGGKIQFCPKCNWKLVKTSEFGQPVYVCPKTSTRLFGKDVVYLAEPDNPQYAEIFKSHPEYSTKNYEVWAFNKGNSAKILSYDKSQGKWYLDGALIEYDINSKSWKLPGNQAIPGIDATELRRDPKTFVWAYHHEPLVYNANTGIWNIKDEDMEIARGSAEQPMPQPLENKFLGYFASEPEKISNGIGKDRVNPDRKYLVYRNGSEATFALTSDDVLAESNHNGLTWVWMTAANMIVVTAFFIGAWLVIGIFTYLARKLFDRSGTLINVLVYCGYSLSLLVPIWMLRYGANIRLHSVGFLSFWHGSYSMPPRLGETTIRFTIGNLLLIPLLFCLIYVLRNKIGEKKLTFIQGLILALPYFILSCYCCI
jgi:hypothetical protein